MTTPDQPRLCVIGSVNMDLVVRTPRLPAPGETILGGPFAVHPGGKGANQAVAAARMGAAVQFVGAVGSDEHGAAMLATLEAEGVDASRVVRIEGDSTGVALISIAADGQNTIVVAPGANASLSPAWLESAREAISAADAVVMQLEVSMEVVSRAAEMARELGTTVILNAAPAGRLSAELLSCVDVLIVNETEGAVLAGEGGEPEHLAAAMGRMGVRTVVVTAGQRGAWYLHDRVVSHAAAFAVEAVDTVGAGDAFVGALATRWAEHQVAGALDAMGVMDAMCWASAAGAIAATRAGAIPSLPQRTEVVQLLRTGAG
jgi:ribokinase